MPQIIEAGPGRRRGTAGPRRCQLTVVAEAPPVPDTLTLVADAPPLPDTLRAHARRRRAAGPRRSSHARRRPAAGPRRSAHGRRRRRRCPNRRRRGAPTVAVDALAVVVVEAPTAAVVVVDATVVVVVEAPTVAVEALTFVAGPALVVEGPAVVDEVRAPPSPVAALDEEAPPTPAGIRHRPTLRKRATRTPPRPRGSIEPRLSLSSGALAVRPNRRADGNGKRPSVEADPAGRVLRGREAFDIFRSWSIKKKTKSTPAHPPARREKKGQSQSPNHRSTP